LIPDILSNICAKYYENPTMLSRVTAKTLGMFLKTQYRCQPGRLRSVSVNFVLHRRKALYTVNGNRTNRNSNLNESILLSSTKFISFNFAIFLYHHRKAT